MYRYFCVCLSIFLLIACGGGGSGDASDSSEGGSSGNGGGNLQPILAQNLQLNGDDLPAICEFSDLGSSYQLRNFVQCQLIFQIELTQGEAADASFVGQFSVDKGVNWQDLTTNNQLTFNLPVSLYNGDVQVRATMLYQQAITATNVLTFSLQENTITIEDAGDFAVDEQLYLETDKVNLTLPSCTDAEQDNYNVVVRRNGRYFFEQQSGAQTQFNSSLLQENDLITAVCVDELGAESTAPGSLQVSFQANPNVNQAPIISFQPLSQSVETFTGLIRDGQMIDVCLNISDFENDIVQTQLTAQTAIQTVDLVLVNNCTQINTALFSGQILTLVAQASDNEETTTAQLELGKIYQDTLPLAQAQNSSCQLNDIEQQVTVAIGRDTEFDVYQVEVVELATGEILRNLGQVDSAIISFSCKQVGLTQYQIVTTSRGKQVRSITYSHSVTSAANQAPLLNFEVTGDLLGVLYRDNQNINICVDASDPDGEVVSYNASFQWDDELPVALDFTDNCSSINTQGRGGQELILSGSVSDSATTINVSRTLGVIYTDTIQFARTQSQSCLLGDEAQSYLINILPDTEGDDHAITVINSETQAIIKVLGSITSGQFTLPCDAIGQTSFYLKNDSRGLTVLSPKYLHSVLAQPNQPPQLSYHLTGDLLTNATGEFAKITYRDNSQLTICLDASDPENQPLTLQGKLLFISDKVERQGLEQALLLDNNNCMTISTFNRGGDKIQLQVSASDGETQTNLTEVIAIIDQDQINIARSQSNQCFAGEGSLNYTVNIDPDIEGDSNLLRAVDIDSGATLASIGIVNGEGEFSLSCSSTELSTSFYIRNDSRGLTTYSLVYQHQVMPKPNTLPEVNLSLINPEKIQEALRDNQLFDVCFTSNDADGDSVQTELTFRFDNEAEQMVNLKNQCGEVSTLGAGNKTITITASVDDGIETVTKTLSYPVHQDTVQFAYTSSQHCKIGDVARTYNIHLADDLEGDVQNLSVYRSDTNTLIQNLGNQRHFNLPCTSAMTVPFYIRNQARNLSTQSVIYQHLVTNVINTTPTINLTLSAEQSGASLQRFNGRLRDQQTIQICATVSDNETAATELNTQVYYRFGNQSLQSLSLNNQCGLISLVDRGQQALVVQGFASDGTATGNTTLDLGVISKDTIQTAISNSGSCRAGDSDNIFSVQVGADIEGDEYAIDVVDAISDEVLASLGKITSGTFSLACDETKAIDFVIRTTSRNLVQKSLVYSHVISDTLNSKPQLSLDLIDEEMFNDQIRDGQTLTVCLTATDADNDEISYKAAYQFANSSVQSLSLNNQQCGQISLSGRGNQNLLLQGFADDGLAETTQILDLGEIHQDTLSIPVTVSASCTIGEESIVYSIDLADDTENDLRKLTVLNANTDLTIAQLDEGDIFEFSMPCNLVGQTQFTINATSRELTTTSAIYTHTVNPSLTNTVELWLTNADKTQLLTKQTEQILRVGTGTATHQIDVSDSIRHQVIKGLGAGLTDSAASLIYQSDNTDAILTQLFDPTLGIGLNRVRVTAAGLGEFVARAAQTYNDRPAGLTDPDLSFFSIDADLDYYLPMLKAIMNENSAVQFDAAAWSAPAWMKDTDALNGGELRLEFYSSYANYLSKYIQAYQAQGVDFASFSLQNQPHLAADYPSMLFPEADYQIFFKDYLYPTLINDGLTTPLWIWDGNWTDYDDQQEASIALFPSNLLAVDFIYGRTSAVALQCYQADNGSDDYSRAISQLTQLTRTRDVFITSCRNQNDGRSFGEYLTDTASEILIDSFNAGASGVMLDSLALDTSFGPHQGGCSDCRAMLSIDQDGDAVANAEYYAFGHFSRFLKTGAVRIEAAQVEGIIATQAFKNLDNSIVLIMVNRSNSMQEIDVNWQGQTSFVQLPALSMMTLIWQSDNSAVADLQLIQQASQLAKNSIALVNSMRDQNGMYFEYLDVTNPHSANRSPAATGLALVALSIAYQMQWDTTASSKVSVTLSALLAELDDYAPARDDSGMFAKRLLADGTQSTDNYSILETAYLLAGAKFAQQVFNNTEINQKVNDLFDSVNWQDVILDAEQGIVATERTINGELINSQGVYQQQMLIVWLAMKAGNLPAKTLWDRYYANGEQFEYRYYNELAIPADQNSDDISPTIHQLNYYLINPVLASANYRQLFESHALAEKDFWLIEQATASYLWGAGYGTDSVSTSNARFNSIDQYEQLVVHAPTIAGFIPANNEYLKDLLAWQTENIALKNTGINGIKIPWRYQISDQTWQSQRIELLGLAPMFMGLAAHPGLLDIQFFRLNNNFTFESN